MGCLSRVGGSVASLGESHSHIPGWTGTGLWGWHLKQGQMKFHHDVDLRYEISTRGYLCRDAEIGGCRFFESSCSFLPRGPSTWTPNPSFVRHFCFSLPFFCTGLSLLSLSLSFTHTHTHTHIIYISLSLSLFVEVGAIEILNPPGALARYHLKMFSAGEHYNSVAPLETL